MSAQKRWRAHVSRHRSVLYMALYGGVSTVSVVAPRKGA